jgi:hypothetical protein
LGPAFYVLYNLVSPDSAGTQVPVDLGQNVVERFGGLGPAANRPALLCSGALGHPGIFEWDKPWRLMLLTAAMARGPFQRFSFASRPLMRLFCHSIHDGGPLENRLPAAFLLLLGFLCLTPHAAVHQQDASAVQRSLAALPVDINPDVRAEAESSTAMAPGNVAEVWPEVPKYLLLGKGYSIDPVDLYLTSEAARSGLLQLRGSDVCR